MTLELPWSADRAIQQFGEYLRGYEIKAKHHELLKMYSAVIAREPIFALGL